jgi:hypothetical protein
MEWAALVVQIEALILLVSPAVALLVQADADDPRPALWCLVLAPVLWRIGHGISRGSRGALLLVASLYVVRVLLTLGSSGGVAAVDWVMMAIEGSAIGLAGFAIRRRSSKADPRWRSELQLATALPVVLALTWWIILVPAYVRRLQQQHLGTIRTPLVALALLMLGTAVGLTWRTALLQRVFDAFRPGVLPPRAPAPTPSQVGRGLAKLVRPPWLDFILATLIGNVAVVVETKFSAGFSQPGAMGAPSLLLIPIGAAAWFGVALLWVTSGLGTYWERRWAKSVRLVAIVSSALLLLITGPFVFGMAGYFITEWLRRL